MSLANAIAQFEAGSGLSVARLGLVFSWFGGVSVSLLITWTIVQYVRGIYEQRIDVKDAIFGAMGAAFVMVAALAFFAVGSPIGPN